MIRTLRIALLILLALNFAEVTTLAQRNKANVRSSSRTSVSRNRDVNVNSRRDVDVNRRTDVNVNRERNIDIDRDVDIDVDVDRHYHGGCCYYGSSGWGVAAAVATTAVVTAAVVGSRVTVLPTGCSTVIVNGFAYQQCGTVWYQPSISGSSTTYVVVNAPR